MRRLTMVVSVITQTTEKRTIPLVIICFAIILTATLFHAIVSICPKPIGDTGSITIQYHNRFGTYSMNNENPNPGWEPEFTLNLGLASGQAFQEIVDAFNESTKKLTELPPLPFTTGWNTVTPQSAEIALRRHRPGANRKPSLSTIVYYAAQMQTGNWPKTGQPLIFTDDGLGLDGQHRLWASYLGLVSFESYVITDVPHLPKLFAYIDNSKVRNASAALQTAGLNGLSPLISQTIQVAHNFDLGIYTCQGKKKRSVRMAPIQVLDYVDKYPLIRRAAHLTAGEYKDAYQAIGHKDITAFVVYKIITLHNEEVCDHFMEELGFPDDVRSETDPLKALCTYLTKQAKSEDPSAKHIVLAHVIKAFNAWITGKPMKRVALATDDAFPQFVEAEKQQEEATE